MTDDFADGGKWVDALPDFPGGSYECVLVSLLGGGVGVLDNSIISEEGVDRGEAEDAIMLAFEVQPKEGIAVDAPLPVLVLRMSFVQLREMTPNLLLTFGRLLGHMQGNDWRVPNFSQMMERPEDEQD